MRDGAVRALHLVAALLGFALVLEGPDLLLVAALDVQLWLSVGIASGLLTLPLLPRWGVGFVPPWAMPTYGVETPLRRVVGYHLLCSVLAAWLWTAPTLRLIAWVHDRRGVETGVIGAVPADAVSVAGGLLLAGLLFFLPALALFVRVSTFRTAVDLHGDRAAELLRPGVVAIGSYLLAGVVVSLLLFVRSAPRTVLPLG
jgi:hypothetical protein